jgi:molybdopterin-guanine dinucleotide biosynthesis protein A
MDAAGFVLAGGRSSRMGSEKALIEFRGEPLVAHALRILRGAGLTALIAGARSALERLAPVVPDLDPGQGPLGGICAAMASSSARWSVCVTVDMPLLPASLVAFLLSEAREERAAVTVASVNGFSETFPVVLDRALLPGLRRALDAGQGGCFAAFQSAAAGLGQAVKVVQVELAAEGGMLVHPEGVPAAFWFLNVNLPADLERAEACYPDRLR